MAAEKLAIKEILSWIDNGESEIWNHLEDDHKKQISFWFAYIFIIINFKGSQVNNLLVDLQSYKCSVCSF